MTLQINGRNFDLTEREVEVLKLIAEGATNAQIAAELCLSVKTVEKHRQSMMNKTGIHNIAGLVHYALSRSLIQNLYAGEPNG